MEKKPLHKQDDALDQYLDSLLHESPHPETEEPAAELYVPADLNMGSEDTPSSAPGDEILHQEETNTPDWASQTFSCLMFSVAGKSLAAPSSRLKGFLEYSNDIEPLDGADKNVIGQFKHLKNQFTVIDTAGLLFEIGYQESDAHHPQNLLVINGTNLALACDSIDDTHEVDPDQIRWRKGQTRQPWYAGIITDQKCALLDLDAVIQRYS